MKGVGARRKQGKMIKTLPKPEEESQVERVGTLPEEDISDKNCWTSSRRRNFIWKGLETSRRRPGKNGWSSSRRRNYM
jgi:hypothetical protein